MLSMLFFTCSPQKKGTSSEKNNQGPDFMPVFSLQPGVMVYKTKKDYRIFVPVVLSEDKSEIMAYPHPSDIMIHGKLTLPEKLESGYILDNRGIQKNIAFLKYTYEEYNRFKTVPPLVVLYENILDKDPLVELCDCGDRNQYPDITAQLNQWIREGKLRKICRQIL